MGAGSGIAGSGTGARIEGIGKDAQACARIGARMRASRFIADSPQILGEPAVALIGGGQVLRRKRRLPRLTRCVHLQDRGGVRISLLPTASARAPVIAVMRN